MNRPGRWSHCRRSRQGRRSLSMARSRGRRPGPGRPIAGERKLLFGKDNFAPLEIGLLVEAGQDLSPSAFHLEPSPAKLALSSEPSGASATLDGRYQGLTPLAISLSSGKQHELRLTLAGHRPESRQLTLGPAESRDLDVRLEPQFGTLFIAVTPASATLSIDGKQQNQASGRFQLPTRATGLKRGPVVGQCLERSHRGPVTVNGSRSTCRAKKQCLKP